jgi:nucleotide-binding universal stress UspA family protein
MIKTILVPATGSDKDNAVFASALTIAREFAAHLEFLHVRPNAAATAVAMAMDGGGAMVGGLIDRLEEDASQREEKARQLFQGFCESEGLALGDAPPGPQGPSARWLREIGTEPYWVAEHGRAADLLVIGRPGEDEGVLLDTLEGALIDSGRPLLIPPAAPLTAVPETIAIAWKPSPQAARALTAASPFLQIAKQIVILIVGEDQRAPEEEADRLMAGLRWHGLPVSVRHLQPAADSSGPETLLSAAAEHAALLVMGGYGRSRLREWVFGGFTLHVLRGAAVPVLMAH